MEHTNREAKCTGNTDTQLEQSESDERLTVLVGQSRRRSTKAEQGKYESAESSVSSGGRKSGGGYCADCSSSDQSSDGDNSGNKLPPLSLNRLNIEDNENSSNEGIDSAETGNRRGETMKSRGAAQNHENAEPSEVASEEFNKLDSYRNAAHSTEQEAASAEPENIDCVALPSAQWNGVSIVHPMDPRIDLSKVQVVRQDSRMLPVLTHAMQSTTHQKPANESFENPGHTIESYLHLMEAVRPFFSAQGLDLSQMYGQQQQQQQQHQQHEAAENRPHTSGSSEGFTAFFTTTDSNGTKSGSPDNDTTDSDKKEQAKNVETSMQHAETHANVKKVYKRQEDSSNTSSGSSGEKRVRIQELHGHLPAAQNHLPNNGHINDVQLPAIDAKPPARIITDISSSNRTDSGVGATTTSGSGSAGNTGSGSNQGSSGSGNDGKGSSEEIVEKDQQSGEATNDCSDTSNQNKLGIGLGDVGGSNRHANAVNQNYLETSALDLPLLGSGASREKKLLDKKRKRIEMRREYEAQQQFESSEGSNPQANLYFPPGKPVTFDQVLVFSSIPRIVVQGSPPFLVVHTNAAYCRLTGIDSHMVVGKPISILLSVVENKENQQKIGISPVDTTRTAKETAKHEKYFTVSPAKELAAAEAHGRAQARVKNRKEPSLGRLIATCGNSHIHAICVSSQPHQMVGKNVTFSKEYSTGMVRRRDEDSNGSSLSSSYEEGQKPRPIDCRMSIAPIVSSSQMSVHAAAADSAHTSKDGPKRPKHYHASEGDSKRITLDESPAKRPPPCQVATHFVIQLQQRGETTPANGSMESLTSNSASDEANMLGLGKSVKADEAASKASENCGEDERSVSESAKSAVAAIG